LERTTARGACGSSARSAFASRQCAPPINSSGTAGELWCHGAETPVLVWQARLVCNECGAMDIDGVATGTERR
jgi:hypothetical protein